jgi:hypothetical protein
MQVSPNSNPQLIQPQTADATNGGKTPRRVSCIRLNEDNIVFGCKIITVILGIVSVFWAKRYFPD